MADPPLLLAVPNVSEGRDPEVLEAIEGAFDRAHFLDLHRDGDHGRAVFTLAAKQGELAPALFSGVREAVKRIDLARHGGFHPHVGAVDVIPVVYLDEQRRGAACAEALTVAGLIGEDLGVPVFLYGELATKKEQQERAFIRRGGWQELGKRIESGELVPDYGPARVHPTAGTVLVAARRPLVAFNIDLDSTDVELAQRIAAGIRESGGGLPGVRALGVYLEERGCAQVTTNVHDYRVTPLRDIVEAVREQAPIAEAELVGLAPEAAFQRFPDDVPLRGFSPERHLIENVLRSLR